MEQGKGFLGTVYVGSFFSIQTVFSTCKDTVFHNLDTFQHEREELLLTYRIGCHKKCLGGVGKQSYGVVP